LIINPQGINLKIIHTEINNVIYQGFIPNIIEGQPPFHFILSPVAFPSRCSAGPRLAQGVGQGREAEAYPSEL
jgi:hypothetical protein